MIGVVDYGAGNLRSVSNGLDALGAAWRHVRTRDELAACERIILPGVGHFGSAIEQLAAAGMVEALRDVANSGKPLLGVCLGAQLLLDGGDEAPEAEGLGLIRGRVVRLTTKTVPHMGWNRVTPRAHARLFATNGCGQHFYFAHSFVCAPERDDDVAAEACCDGQRFCVAVQRGNVYGVQFHPEKSASAGLDLLRRFATC